VTGSFCGKGGLFVVKNLPTYSAALHGDPAFLRFAFLLFAFLLLVFLCFYSRLAFFKEEKYIHLLYEDIGPYYPKKVLFFFFLPPKRCRRMDAIERTRLPPSENGGKWDYSSLHPSLLPTTTFTALVLTRGIRPS
jgi:hypothetical protein